MKMFEKKWSERKLKLNQKIVIRLPEDLYQKLLSFLENNPKYPTISAYVRALITDHLSGKTESGLKT